MGGGEGGSSSSGSLSKHCGAWVPMAKGLSLLRGCAVVHGVGWLQRVNAVESRLGASIGQQWP